MSDEPFERKLAAVVAADVVGYSRLMGLDETGTLTRLNTLRRTFIVPAIAEYHGRIVKLMGDGILIEFPSVVDALSCSVRIQRELPLLNESLPEDQRIEFRIGINLGDIIVEGDDIHGDGVNIAARLEPLAEPGGICISQFARDALGNKLPLDYEDMGARTLKNIAEPMHAYRVIVPLDFVMPEVRSSSHEATKAFTQRPVRSRRWALVIVALLLLGAVSGVFWWQQQSEQTGPAKTTKILPDKPSIAILPFTNNSSDSNQEFFVDGLTEDLITDLAKLSNLFVISRNSVFTYKGKAVNVPQIAQELGVRYILEGSVQRAGDRIRVNAQLIEAKTDHHLWAERYDREIKDIFAVQDELKQQIIGALELQFDTKSIPAYNIPTENIEAYEYYLRGRRVMHLNQLRNQRLAYYALEKALDLDPSFAEAQAALAMAYALDYSGKETWASWERSPKRSRTNVVQLAERALKNKPDLAMPHVALARLKLADRKFDESLEHVEQAISKEPGDSLVYETHALVLTALGNHSEALRAMQHAMRLDPKPPGYYYSTLGKIQFALHRYEEAQDSLERASAAEISGFTWHSSYFLPAVYAYLEQAEKARPWLTDKMSIEAARQHPFYRNEIDIEHYIEGLRLAGVPQYAANFDPLKDAGAEYSTEALERLITDGNLAGVGVIHTSGGNARSFEFLDSHVQLRYGFIEDSGSAKIVRDRLCITAPSITRGQPACYRVFDNPNKTPLNDHYDQVWAGEDLIYLNHQ